MTAPLWGYFLIFLGLGPLFCTNYCRIRLFIYTYFKGLDPLCYELLASLNSTVISLLGVGPFLNDDCELVYTLICVYCGWLRRVLSLLLTVNECRLRYKLEMTCAKLRRVACNVSLAYSCELRASVCCDKLGQPRASVGCYLFMSYVSRLWTRAGCDSNW